ncbi:Protein F28C6.8 b [Aphelenchoides avenae]|nr:Protein F28C6.8 b [Aphelenchus avenae]
MFGYVVCYGTLAYNLVRNYVNPEKRPWYSRIDDLVGAVPFRSMIATLVEKENVGGVVCCTEEFETKAAALFGAVRPGEWEAAGVHYHRIPIEEGDEGKLFSQTVEFIDNATSDGKSVYVHCNAGRSRSATIATCYLMHRNAYAQNVALEVIKKKRPQVFLRNCHWRTLNDYQRLLDDARRSPVQAQKPTRSRWW